MVQVQFIQFKVSHIFGNSKYSENTVDSIDVINAWKIQINCWELQTDILARGSNCRYICKNRIKQSMALHSQPNLSCKLNE